MGFSPLAASDTRPWWVMGDSFRVNSKIAMELYGTFTLDTEQSCKAADSRYFPCFVTLCSFQKSAVSHWELKIVARSGTKATKVHPMYSFPTNTCAMSKSGFCFFNAPIFGDVGLYPLCWSLHEMPLDLCKTPWNVQKICEEARKFRAWKFCPMKLRCGSFVPVCVWCLFQLERQL